MKTLGDRLRNAREAKNLTQKAVYDLTGINNKTISNYENNVSSPDPETLKVFADLYEVSVDNLLGRACPSGSGKSVRETENDYVLDVSELPEEAIKQVKDYIELIKLKYNLEGYKKSR